MLDKDTECWIRELVQRQDRDRYLCCMFLPSSVRHAVFCVLAFHAEVARIRENITEPQMGYIRVQWWREALENTSPSLGQSPVILALRELPMWMELKPALQKLLEARRSEIERPPFVSVDDVEAWLQAIIGPLTEALAIAANLTECHNNLVLQKASIAHGLMGILRSTKTFQQQGRPLWQQDLSTQSERTALAKLITERTQTALVYIQTHQHELPKSAFPLLLPAVLAEQHMKILIKADWNIDAPQFVGPSRLTIRFLWSWLRRHLL